MVEQLTNGFQGLHCLREFSLKHDCNNQILEALARHCWYTLQILDIENSKQVNNNSVEWILSCQNIMELNVFKTSINDEGKGRLIHYLPKLMHLPRGDFLCDALAWIGNANFMLWVETDSIFGGIVHMKVGLFALQKCKVRSNLSPLHFALARPIFWKPS